MWCITLCYTVHTHGDINNLLKRCLSFGVESANSIGNRSAHLPEIALVGMLMRMTKMGISF